MPRIQLELPDSQVTQLRDLMDEGNLGSYKDVFNNALALFEWALKERKLGRVIASIDETGQTVRELAMPALDSVERSMRSKAAL